VFLAKNKLKELHSVTLRSAGLVKYIYIVLFTIQIVSKLLHSINQKQLNSVCLLLERHPSLVEQINGMMGDLI